MNRQNIIKQILQEGLTLPKQQQHISGDYPHGEGSKTIYWPKTADARFVHETRRNGTWTKYKYDEKGNELYNENSNGYWQKFEYDKWGYKLSFEDSTGYKVNYK